MRSVVHQTSRTRRAVSIGLLVAVPLLPVTACGDTGGGGSGDSEVEEVENEEQGEGDGGAY